MRKPFESDLAGREFVCALSFDDGQPCGAKCVLVRKPVSGGKRDLVPVCPHHGGSSYIKMWRGEIDTLESEVRS